MQYFLQIGVIKQHPEEVAMFFKNTAGLDKAKIGEYIGEKYVIGRGFALTIIIVQDQKGQ